ncbi:helix-turn-helix transcriptional regulator [Francisella sp. 19X1-34]|uniref:AraC family transcriptional regulator n=1 Tax=Francisella sp. 19X1-34 TaxID=3087177 RepID=UPI002E35CDDE|nr:helix-turn-helix transcriptional regulator [Francisella sp. 19X1-34]MED7789559.1 helix-turn-helix transcriptional regulator [Francisella sp. 19X1-34]
MVSKHPPLLRKNIPEVFGVSHNGKPFLDELHYHEQAQLMYCSKGIIEAQVSEKIFLVPPTNAIWIPGNVPHGSLSKNPVNFRSIYFCTKKFANLPKKVQVISISPLLRELILEVCNFKGEDLSLEQNNIIAVIIDQLHSAKPQDYILEIPDINIIKSIYKYVIENLSEALLIEQVAKHFAMSSKTLTRLFQKHVGMTFEQWKQQVKILEAISLLSQEVTTTTQVAQALGYSSDSAFIHRFKKVTGKTPMEFKKK